MKCSGLRLKWRFRQEVGLNLCWRALLSVSLVKETCGRFMEVQTRKRVSNDALFRGSAGVRHVFKSLWHKSRQCIGMDREAGRGDKVVYSRTEPGEAQEALHQCQLIQKLVDISISSLQALRTKCAATNDLTQQEIRTLEVQRWPAIRAPSPRESLSKWFEASATLCCVTLHV